VSLATDPPRHPRRCTVCSHPDREAIEADFLRWRSPDENTCEYHLGNRSTIYRHANSTGLFRRRKEQFARVLEFFPEQADTCSLEDANVIIRAARIYAQPTSSNSPAQKSRRSAPPDAVALLDVIVAAPHVVRARFLS